MLSPTQATCVGIRACACAALDASDAKASTAVPIAIRTFSGADAFMPLLCRNRPDPINDQDDRPAPYSPASSCRLTPTRRLLGTPQRVPEPSRDGSGPATLALTPTRRLLGNPQRVRE